MKKQENLKHRFLLDQNISFKTVSFLESLGFDAKTLNDFGLKGKPDEQIVSMAKQENRTIITFDKDFGEIYYFSERGRITVIILYLADQRYENVNTVLEKFLSTTDLNLIKNKLIIVYKDRIRIIGE